MSKEEMLKKILICARVLIVFAVINTILLLIAVGEPSPTKANNTSKNTDTSESTDASENTEYDVSMFDEISGSDFIKLFNDKKSGTNVIYLGREGCSYCVAFLPTLQQAQSELGYTTKYLDITTVSESDAQKITELNDFLSENYGSTPLVIITKDGKYVDGSVGYAEYEEFIAFLNKNGIK